MDIKEDNLITLLPLMVVERVGIIVILAFLLFQMKSFNQCFEVKIKCKRFYLVK